MYVGLYALVVYMEHSILQVTQHSADQLKHSGILANVEFPIMLSHIKQVFCLFPFQNTYKAAAFTKPSAQHP